MTAAVLDLQGHRGARGLAPENTLPSFARALAIGVTTLELDCGVTRDGVVVVSHDMRLNPDITRLDGRWIGGPGPAIHALTFAELARYDVGAIRPFTAYAARFPWQQRMDDVRIPRLADVFALVREAGNDHVRFNIETKIDAAQPELTVSAEAFAGALIDEVRAAGVARRTMIQSFDWRTLAIVQRVAADIETSYLTDRSDSNADALARIEAAGGRIWSPDYRALDRALVDAARKRGMRVIPWTVNEPADIASIIGLGVDGLITDYPDAARAIMQRAGLPPPQPGSGAR